MVEVSVIIPAFNAEKTLGRCLDSVLSQALELEVIVIDDCSTDGTVALCKRYVDRDERVRLLRNSQNIGQGLSRNRGIEVAFGTFLAFVDADDYLAPHMYEDLLSLMRAGNLHIDVAGCALLYPAPNALRGGGFHDSRESGTTTVPRSTTRFFLPLWATHRKPPRSRVRFPYLPARIFFAHRSFASTVSHFSPSVSYIPKIFSLITT